MLILSTWFCYANPLDLAYVYLFPLLLMISIALYPLLLSTVAIMWGLLVPYCLLRSLYVTLIGSITSYVIENKGWSESSARWIAYGWYVALALILCQARVSLNNKFMYGVILSAHYTFDNAFFPLYNLGLRGMTFIAEGKMIAFLRAILVDIEQLPFIPESIIQFIKLIAHPQCDHLFGKTASTAVLRESIQAANSGIKLQDLFDWSIVPNQSCRVPVPALFRAMGGAFESSGGELMTISTSEKFVHFNYRPRWQFFFNTLWYSPGAYGMFRGMYYAVLLTAFTYMVYVFSKPNARSCYLLKEKLVASQRGLYKYGCGIMEATGIITSRDRAERRMCLVSLPPSKSYGRNRFTDWFIKRYAPSNDLDHLHERFQELDSIVTSCHLETAIAQKPGLQSAPGLKGILTVLTHEAACMSEMARVLASKDFNNGEDWYTPISAQIMTGQTRVLKVAQDSAVATTWFRSLFFGYWRICELVERVLSVDEVGGRDKAVVELLSDLRHSLQLELRDMSHLLKNCPPDVIRSTQNASNHLIRTFGYGSIEKCKATILYCENEMSKSVGTWLKACVTTLLGPVISFVTGLLRGWVEFFTGFNPKVPKDDMPDERYNSPETIYAGVVVRSRERKVRFLQNVEFWGGLRFFIGQIAIFTFFFFNNSMATKSWLHSNEVHRQSPNFLGEELAAIGEMDTSLLYNIFPPSDDDRASAHDVVLIPGLFWAAVPMLKISKLVPWTFLGFYCSNLITYQGTVKRSALRYVAMLMGTGTAWLACWLSFKFMRDGADDVKNPPSDSAYIFAPGSSSGAYILTFLCAVGCVNILFGTLAFSNPFNGGRRYTFDPQWGYMGQILTYHFLVVSYGLYFDFRQSREELVLLRVLGHTFGTALSLVLAFLFFPTSANTQQRIRLANMTVPIRKSFIAFNHVFLQSSEEAAGAVDEATWKSYFDGQLQALTTERAHYDKIVVDASICDTVSILHNDKVLLEIGSILNKILWLRTSAQRLLQNLESRSSHVRTEDVWERDATFRDWVEQVSPLREEDQEQFILAHNAPDAGIRSRPQPLKFVRPVSPYRWYSYESGDSQDPVWPRARPPHYTHRSMEESSDSSVETGFGDDAIEEVVNSMREEGGTVRPQLSSSPPPAGGDEDSCGQVLELLAPLNTLWLMVEHALLNMGSKKFDHGAWSASVLPMVASLHKDIDNHLDVHLAVQNPRQRRSHLLYSIWADEISSLARVIQYIIQYNNSP